MSSNQARGWNGCVRVVGNVAMAALVGCVTLSCGNASKDDCDTSVIAAFASECGETDGNGTGATDGGGSGGNTGGNTGSVPKAGRGPTPASGGSEHPDAACRKLGSLPNAGATDAEASESVVVHEWGQAEQEGTLDAGDWEVNSTKSVWKGLTAVHPPEIEPGDEPAMTFDCGGEDHTQLSFVARRLTEGAELELFDGAQSRGKINVGGDWHGYAINVPAGKHEYKLVARNLGTTTLTPPYVLDTFTCKSVTPGAGYNGLVTYDDGFVPVELQGDWFVDGLRGAHQGEAAIHPPAIRPGDEPSMSFDCAGQEHTELSFVVRRLVENAELELCDGTQSRGRIQVGGDWHGQIINVPKGQHKYTFVARNLGTTDISEPYVIDTFACKSTEPAPGHNGLVTADGGFVPPEMQGGWFVDNLRGAHQGTAAVHPPVMEPGAEPELAFDCSSHPHSNLKFVARRLVEGAELELFDGDDSQGTVDVGGDWRGLTFQVESGQYRFVARNLGKTRLAESYVLDTFSCE